MFGPAFFGVTHYGPTYFPPARGDVIIALNDDGGSGHKRRQKVILSKQLNIDERDMLDILTITTLSGIFDE
jgi:hypothetical protein